MGRAGAAEGLSKRTTMPSLTSPPWRRASSQTASGEPGAVHGAAEAADRIARWLGALGCRTLNVAGPRASEEAGIHAAAGAVLRRAISEHLGGQRKDGQEGAFAQAADR